MEKSASIYIDIDGSDNIPPYDQSPAERFAGMTREEIDDKSGVASTVLDCTVNPPRILREGAVTEADIRAAR